MTWYAVVESATGRLYAVQDHPPVPTPAGHDLVEFAGADRPDIVDWYDPVAGENRPLGRPWNPVTRSWGAAYDPPVVVDRVLDDLTDDPDLVAVWLALTPAQRQVLRDKLVALLGRRRWRYAGEPFAVESAGV